MLGLAAALAVLGWPAADAARAASATARFNSPGAYSFTVPAGVTSVTAILVGAAGGSCLGGVVGPGAPVTGVGGAGAAVTAMVPVSPSQPLFVGVGAPGAACGPGAGDGGSGGGAGGLGGGGNGGNGTAGARGGAGGGGASVVGFASPSPGVPGLLAVAGGGGGAGNIWNGGPSGSDGQAAGLGGQGLAGTLTAGGQGGRGEHGHPGGAGASGSFGVGGAGAGGGACDGGQGQQVASGGGGGGGGYYGGGGAAWCQYPPSDFAPDGYGGGGGSSFVAPGGTIVLGPTPTSSEAGVSITYAAPTADVSPTAVSFASQPPGTAGAEQTLTVTNKGSAPLVVSGVLLGGSDPDDFLVSDRCRQPVAAGSSCQVGVRFDPQASGVRSARLTVLSNAPRVSKPVALSGIGAGVSARPLRPPGTAAVISCEPIHVGTKHGERGVTPTVRCARNVVSGKVKFSGAGPSIRATIVRGHVVSAVGVSDPGARGGSRLVLAERRPLRHGTYTLILRHRRGRHWVSQRISMVLG
jgi:hypothetical protein